MIFKKVFKLSSLAIVEIIRLAKPTEVKITKEGDVLLKWQYPNG